MCGIAGAIGWHEAPVRADVERQVATLRHRGPDASGVFAAGRLAVGQTRLSIIDLVTGDPPIATPDGRIGVAFNGEIYNYAALRRELLDGGHRLRTTGDTEVIAHLAESLSAVDLARRLHGMFAFAVADVRDGSLALVRDRFGKKPLYWARTPRGLVFGSEIKAVLAHPDVTARLDPAAIPAYLGFGYVPSPATFYDGIRSVPPGHALLVDAAGRISTEAYWRPPLPGVDATTSTMAPDDAASAVRDALDRSVRRRLVADVPIGAFLSGGIDSASVAALMARASDRPISTFTIGFDDGSFDERDAARVTATAIGSEHHEFVVHPDAAALLDRLVWHHDQPFGDSSALPTYLLAEVTRSHVTVALSGDGSDELFAGYERLAAAALLARLGPLGAAAAPVARALAVPLRRGPQRIRDRAERFADAVGSGMPDALRRWVAYTPDGVVDALVPGGAAAARAGYRSAWDATRGAHPLDRVLRLNIDTYLLDDLLPKADRMSMAHGLEVRSPFLDHELAELVLTLPPTAKARGMSRKRVLKAAVADLVPPAIVDRPKKGFGVPIDRWFRDELAPLVDATLLAADARLRAHVDHGAVEDVVAAHRAGASRGHTLWTLLTLELFLRSRGW